VTASGRALVFLTGKLGSRIEEEPEVAGGKTELDADDELETSVRSRLGDAIGRRWTSSGFLNVLSTGRGLPYSSPPRLSAARAREMEFDCPESDGPGTDVVDVG
jgi:hypothetical protein